MKKRFFVLLSASCFLTVMISCGGETQQTGKTTEPVVETQVEETEAPKEVVAESTVDVSKGKPVYDQNCAACHQANGEGITGAFPTLKGADFLENDKATIIKIALNGSKDENGNPVPITVNGTEYPGGAMAVNHIPDEDAVEVVNYILNSWGNNYGTVTLDDIKAHR